jgi:hypothetical protein
MLPFAASRTHRRESVGEMGSALEVGLAMPLALMLGVQGLRTD